jgi:hypothetical protein
MQRRCTEISARTSVAGRFRRGFLATVGPVLASDTVTAPEGGKVRDADGIDRDTERAATRELYDALADWGRPDAEVGSNSASRLLARIEKDRAKLGPDDGEPVDLERLLPSTRELLTKIRDICTGRNTGATEPLNLDDLDLPNLDGE